MAYQYIMFDVSDGVATLTLNRPEKMNALLEEELLEIQDAVSRARVDASARVLILTGAGDAFCSGADLSRLARQAAGGSAHALKRREDPVGWFMQDIYDFPKPTIAAVNGPAIGGGCSLALVCEIRIASDRAKLSMAWVARGIPPDTGATWLLPRIVGPARAAELAYAARTLDAQEALRLGLVNSVVPHADLPTAARALARSIAQQPPLAIALAKRGMRRAYSSTFAEALDFETFAQEAAFASDDFKEAIAAFKEKRPPTYTGR